ncbi:thioredoxin family protein [Thalassolituus oleivorans]|uniref:Thiol-disulfide isomerase/thioredoxin n=1 Tax=Thalassolituus oleivorans MIL-1 TaxID=1298593 RepID=M5DSK4_9GAMM|nr:thioredoxin family protein [Thalassolituus oleivorans]PHQ85755.1 MAG: thioredoxin family protein [Thalassobium sp.]CCU72162.1 thiol-disulfide isomerase/thioredoxin [Thalassolituus oleivorans MIL-1]
MKVFKVLGTGCAKCKSTVQLIEETAKAQGAEVKVEKIEDLPQIMAYGVMSTPAVVMNETVIHKGSIPDRATVIKWLES